MSNPISTNVPVTASVAAEYNGQPTKGVIATIVWESSNASVATVDAGGLVTPVAVGSATITATCSGTLLDGTTFTNVQATGVVNVTGVLQLSISFQ